MNERARKRSLPGFSFPRHTLKLQFHAGEHIDAQIAVLIVTVNPLVGQVTPFEEHADPFEMLYSAPKYTSNCIST